ncbi:MAG: hypothetical protein ACREFE_10290, partial [Limisphaerales bacterium]
MTNLLKRKAALVLILAGFCAAVRASNLDTIGVTLLRMVTTNLNGAGIPVGQAEAQDSTNPPTWEVNPGAVGQLTNLFTYFYGTSPYLIVSTANT